MLELVKQRLAQLGYNVKEADEPLLLYVIEKVELEVKVFTNLRVRPPELDKVIADKVAIEFLMTMSATNRLTEVEVAQVVKSITEGDTTVQYADDSSAPTLNILLSYLMAATDKILMGYRRIRW